MELFWHEVIKWLEKITPKKLILNETLLVLALFTGRDENSSNKELVEILTGAVRTEIAHTWKNTQGLSFKRCLDRTWTRALIEKLTIWARLLRGVIKTDNFVKIWHLLFVSGTELNRENTIGSRLDYWSAIF